MSPAPALETRRMLLRQWKEEDYDPFHEMNMALRVEHYHPPFLNRAASDAFIDRARELFDRQGWGIWVIERREDGAFLGWCGLHLPNVEAGMPHACVSLFWRLDLRFWGKGYVAEAAREVLRHAFETMGEPELGGYASPDNRRAVAIYSGLGMRSSGERFAPLFFPPGHPHRVQEIFRITRAEWEAARKAEREDVGPIRAAGVESSRPPSQGA